MADMHSQASANGSISTCTRSHHKPYLAWLVRNQKRRRIKMAAALGMMGGVSAAAGGRVFAATAATKTAGGSGESKGILDWILGGLQKEDQLLETDPILQKVEGKNGTVSRRGTVSVPANNNNKKPGGFGGLFLKKD